MFFAGEPSCGGLVEARALGREKDDARLRTAQFVERIGDRFDFEHHTGSAAVGRFIGHAMLARSPVAQITHPDLGQTFFPGDPQHAFAEDPLAHGREQGQDVDLHRGLANMAAIGQPDNV